MSHPQRPSLEYALPLFCFFLVNVHILNTYQMFLFETIVETMKKVYKFATILVGISNKISLQSAPFDLLTEIRDGMQNIGNLLKAENTSFKLTSFENLDDFYKFEQSLKDTVIEENIVRDFTFTM